MLELFRAFSLLQASDAEAAKEAKDVSLDRRERQWYAFAPAKDRVEVFLDDPERAIVFRGSHNYVHEEGGS